MYMYIIYAWMYILYIDYMYICMDAAVPKAL